MAAIPFRDSRRSFQDWLASGIVASEKPITGLPGIIVSIALRRSRRRGGDYALNPLRRQGLQGDG